MFKKNDWIILTSPDRLMEMDRLNINLIEQFSETPLRIITMSSNGAATKFTTIQNKTFDFTITSDELKTCFSPYTEFGDFKIIITYIEEGKTIEEEGIHYININNTSIEYRFNRKRMGFLKYKGEISLELKELKQITLSTPLHEKVLHIENGIIVREHVLYDTERKFTNIQYGNC